MPKVSLVVCLFRERDLLQRLLEQAEGCYDDLIVIHDGPETTNGETNISIPSHADPRMAVDYSEENHSRNSSFWTTPEGTPLPNSINQLVARHSGRFFEGPRSWQQETHWPFAWSQAKYDWILRLDSDEFPSEELRQYLRHFREASDTNASISGYACIWPYWNGKRATTSRWPDNRLFLFHRHRTRFFGLAEQAPIPDGSVESLPFILHHQPHGKRYGIRKVLFRKQAFFWRRLIALSLLRTPCHLPRWRWQECSWPDGWARLRARPIREGFIRLLLMPIHQARDIIRTKDLPTPSKCLGSATQHFLLGLELSRLKSRMSPNVDDADTNC